MVFLDTNIFLFAVGNPHVYKAACKAILGAVADGSLQATTSVEVVQEILYVLSRRGQREEGVNLSGEVISMFPDMLPVERRDMALARIYIQEKPGMSARDAVHAATIVNNGLSGIVTGDRDFERLDDLVVLTPDAALRSLT